MPSTPEPARRSPLGYLLPILALLAACVAWAYWPSAQVLSPPPGLSAGEIAATDDPTLFGRIGQDLSWRLVAPREDRTVWRSFNEPARQVFLVTRFEAPLRQGDLATICATAQLDPAAPQPDEIAAAFRTIGTARVATACAGLAACLPLPEPGMAAAPDPFRSLSQELRAALAAEDPVPACAAYIRAHAVEVASPLAADR